MPSQACRRYFLGPAAPPPRSWPPQEAWTPGQARQEAAAHSPGQEAPAWRNGAWRTARRASAGPMRKDARERAGHGLAGPPSPCLRHVSVRTVARKLKEMEQIQFEGVRQGVRTTRKKHGIACPAGSRCRRKSKARPATETNRMPPATLGCRKPGRPARPHEKTSSALSLAPLLASLDQFFCALRPALPGASRRLPVYLPSRSSSSSSSSPPSPLSTDRHDLLRRGAGYALEFATVCGGSACHGKTSTSAQEELLRGFGLF